jgi:hypothetical protein
MAVKKPWDLDYPNEPDYPSPVDQAASNDPNAPIPPATSTPTQKSYEQILAERKAAEDAAAAAANPPPTTNPPGFDQYGQPKTQPDPTTPPTTTTPTPDTSAWDTGGYAKPAYTSTNYNQQAVSGYDPAKWANPAHQTPKYVVGRILSGYNLNDPTQLQTAMADIAKAYPGTTWAGKDVINVPGIGNVDVIRDFGGESGIAWQPESDAVGAAGGTLGGTALSPYGSSALTSSFSSTSGVPATGTSSSATTASQVASGSSDPALNDASRAAILELLQRDPPTPQELMDSPENQAYRLAAQRAEERQRAELAEDAAFQGYDNTGFFDTELQGIRQQRGEGEAGFLGELAVSRMQAQREDLQFAIAQAQQAGQFDLAQQLQREAMSLDAAIRREQMASTERMTANDLALREFLGRAGIDLDRLRLGEDSRQFNYGYGLDAARLNETIRQFDKNYVLPKGT